MSALETFLLVFALGQLRSFAFLMFIRPLRAAVRPQLLAVLAAAASFSHSLRASESLPAVSITDWFLVALFEVVVGAMLALPFSFAAEGLLMAGRIVDTARGAQYGEQLNLGLQGMTSPLEQLAATATLAIALSLGAGTLACGAIRESLVILPPTSLLNLLHAGAPESGLEALLKLGAEALAVALSYAAPVLLGSLLIDLGAGLAGRALARVNLAGELMPLKMIWGLVVLAVLLEGGWVGGDGGLEGASEAMYNLARGLQLSIHRSISGG